VSFNSCDDFVKRSVSVDRIYYMSYKDLNIIMGIPLSRVLEETETVFVTRCLRRKDVTQLPR
jgi:hypothetical protein